MTNDNNNISATNNTNTSIDSRSVIDKHYAWKSLDKMVRKFRHEFKRFEPDIVTWLKGTLDPAIKNFIEYIFKHTHISDI